MAADVTEDRATVLMAEYMAVQEQLDGARAAGRRLRALLPLARSHLDPLLRSPLTSHSPPIPAVPPLHGPPVLGDNDTVALEAPVGLSGGSHPKFQAVRQPHEPEVVKGVSAVGLTLPSLSDKSERILGTRGNVSNQSAPIVVPVSCSASVSSPEDTGELPADAASDAGMRALPHGSNEVCVVASECELLRQRIP